MRIGTGESRVVTCWFDMHDTTRLFMRLYNAHAATNH